MKRRTFIAGVGSAAVRWPVVARTQQPTLPVIGYLSCGDLRTQGNFSNFPPRDFPA